MANKLKISSDLALPVDVMLLATVVYVSNLATCGLIVKDGSALRASDEIMGAA